MTEIKSKDTNKITAKSTKPLVHQRQQPSTSRAKHTTQALTVIPKITVAEVLPKQIKKQWIGNI